jgi:hypothetical protein
MLGAPAVAAALPLDLGKLLAISANNRTGAPMTATSSRSAPARSTQLDLHHMGQAPVVQPESVAFWKLWRDVAPTYALG